jgi:hypothetical protein
VNNRPSFFSIDGVLITVFIDDARFCSILLLELMDLPFHDFVGEQDLELDSSKEVIFPADADDTALGISLNSYGLQGFRSMLDSPFTLDTDLPQFFEFRREALCVVG